MRKNIFNIVLGCALLLPSFVLHARYMESDPLGLGGGINTYEYVSGSPVTMADPQGLSEEGMYGADNLGGWARGIKKQINTVPIHQIVQGPGAGMGASCDCDANGAINSLMQEVERRIVATEAAILGGLAGGRPPILPAPLGKNVLTIGQMRAASSPVASSDGRTLFGMNKNFAGEKRQKVPMTQVSPQDLQAQADTNSYALYVLQANGILNVFKNGPGVHHPDGVVGNGLIDMAGTCRWVSKDKGVWLDNMSGHYTPYGMDNYNRAIDAFNAAGFPVRGFYKVD